MSTAPPLQLAGVAYVRGRRPILRGITWEVGQGEHWAVLGRNGAGKSTLLRIASTYALPTRGAVDVLGHRVGRSDLRVVRRGLGIVAPWLAADLADDTRTRDAVLTGVDATLRRFRQDPTPQERARADELLRLVGCEGRAALPFGRLSDGERQRVLLARALMPAPRLLLLDEPTANLDVAGRELLLATLGRLSEDDQAPATVVVTHHLEEIPPGCDHVLLLREGEVLAAGPIDDVLTDRTLSRCFDVPLRVHRSEGRLHARVRTNV